MSGERILLVEDDTAMRSALRRLLQASGYELTEGATLQAAEISFRARRPDAVLCDYELPDGNGFDLLPRFKRIDPEVPIMMLTGHATIALAVKAIKEGAEQFITKPVDTAAMLTLLQRVLEERRVRLVHHAVADREAQQAPDPFLGTSDAIGQLKEQAQRLAGAEGPILLTGETGSGKGVLTRWLHDHGSRRLERFVDLNCAGLSRELMENELFGHERGAFTGAQATKPGLLDVAHKGTLFLDEIGDIDQTVQPRLLKVLEDGKFRRLGDVKDRVVDVRLVAATHHDLEKAVAENRFRGDLYYRIGVLPLRIPPLRERREDVPALARALLGPRFSLSEQANRALSAYHWPGNVRELRNVLERARVLSDSTLLDVEDLHLVAPQAALPVLDESSLTLEQMERQHIEIVLRRARGKVSRASELLGIARSSLYQKLQRYGIEGSRN